MGTRSVIAQPHGDGFRGRYHHWDGYPTGLGATLWELYHGHFGEDVDEMVGYLITDEPIGWSSINGADFTMPKGWHDSCARDGNCGACGQEYWRHYRHYYADEGATPIVPDEVAQLGHTFERIVLPQGPQSYSVRGETTDQPDGEWIYSDGDDGGTEWAYVLGSRSLFVFERRYGMPHDDQGHGTGMFGMGASDTEDGGYWAPVAECAWGGDEPDWEALNEGSPLVAGVR